MPRARAGCGCLGCSFPLIALAALAVALVVVLAGCGGNSAPVAAPAAPSQTPAPAASPDTAAGAVAAATTYFDLYSAGQYTATYDLITPAARSEIKRNVWVGAHVGCPSAAASLTYKITHPVLTGSTAVVTVSLAGIASALASEESAFRYSGGQWHYEPTDVSVYKNHTTAQALADLKAQDYCSD